MKTRVINEYQVIWDGITVWVNAPDGVNRARYSGRIKGIDVHHDLATQIRTGKQCLACGVGEWEEFVGLVQKHLGVTLPEEARPTCQPFSL